MVCDGQLHTLHCFIHEGYQLCRMQIADALRAGHLLCIRLRLRVAFCAKETALTIGADDAAADESILSTAFRMRHAHRRGWNGRSCCLLRQNEWRNEEI